MYRSFYFILAITFIACNPKTIPAKNKSVAAVFIYKVYKLDSNEVKETGIDFSTIPNLRKAEGVYMKGMIGITDRQEDMATISTEIYKKHNKSDDLIFIWSSKPLRHEYPNVRAYVLFAIMPDHQPSLDTLNSHFLNVTRFWDHETFEPGILIHYTEDGKQLLKKLTSDESFRNIPVAYVFDGAVWDLRRFRSQYHKSLSFYRFDIAEDAKILAEAINKKI